MDQELVSVIMSVYNESEKEMRNSIDSILNQSYPNFELIIINDNPSRDVNTKILSEINNEKTRIYNNDTNLGLVRSLNYALSKANGVYIARMDADDISKTDRIEKQVNYLKNANCDLIGSWIELINEDDQIKGKIDFPISEKKIIKDLRFGGSIAHPSWLAKKEIYSSLGGYREVPHCEDYDFLNRAIVCGYKLGNIPEYCLMYRIRENSVSKKNKIQQLLLRRFLSSHRKIIDKLTVEDITAYLSSESYIKKYNSVAKYEQVKEGIRNRRILDFIKIIFCKELYYYLGEKVISKF